MKWLTITVFSLLTQWTNAQNLVLNPSFEINNAEFCGIMNSNDFSSTAGDWYAPSQGSPDLYFTSIKSSCINFQPNSTYSGPIGIKGSQLPRTGEVMSGLFAYTIQGLEQREYIQVPLSSPLIIGEKYLVECFVSLADSTEFATDKLGMFLSAQAVSLQANGALNYSPQVIAPGFITDTQNWVQISDTITATDAYAYLTIGNFKSDANTPTVQNANYSGKPGTYGSYYFIDDVRVEHIRGLNTIESEFNKADRKLVKVIDFMGRETEFKPNTPLILIYSDGTSERVVKIEE